MLPLLDALNEHLSVPLRGLALTAQAFAVGGVAFLLLLAVPLASHLGAGLAILRRAGRMTAWAGFAVALLAAARIVLQLGALVAAGIPFGQALGAGFVGAWGLQTAAGLAIAGLLPPGRRPPSATVQASLAVAALTILGGSVSTSHAAGRLEGGAFLGAATALHELGAAVWIGGLPCFLAALALADHDGAALRAIGRRYSLMATGGVAAVAGAGIALAVLYVGSWPALYGTAYGLMTGVKVALFLALLGLGVANYRVVERLRRDPATPALRLRRFAEVELGIGIAVFVVAASLTSAPPSVDVPAEDRVALTDIGERIWPPAVPRLRSPSSNVLAVSAQPDRTAPLSGAETPSPANIPGDGIEPSRGVSDTAWSEFERAWAGILLLAVGALAVAERFGLPWGRRWPLLFLGFAIFLVLESDPAIRQLGGGIGPLAPPSDAVGAPHHDENARHLAAILLAFALAVLGLLEWGLRTGWIVNPRAMLVFPLACTSAALLLLAHGHTASDPREALLVSISSSLVALLSLAAGWSRWVELRLPGTRAGRFAAWTWPVCLLAIGLVLLGYRMEPPQDRAGEAGTPFGVAGTQPWPG